MEQESQDCHCQWEEGCGEHGPGLDLKCSLSPAFILMIILALIRISRGQAEGHPSMAQLSGRKQ